MIIILKVLYRDTKASELNFRTTFVLLRVRGGSYLEAISTGASHEGHSDRGKPS